MSLIKSELMIYAIIGYYTVVLGVLTFLVREYFKGKVWRVGSKEDQWFMKQLYGILTKRFLSSLFLFLVLIAQILIWPIWVSLFLLNWKVFKLKDQRKRMFAMVLIPVSEINLVVLSIGLVLCSIFLNGNNGIFLIHYSILYLAYSSVVLTSYWVKLFDNPITRLDVSQSLLGRLGLSIISPTLGFGVVLISVISATAFAYLNFFSGWDSFSSLASQLKELLGPVNVTLWAFGYKDKLLWIDVFISFSSVLLSGALIKDIPKAFFFKRTDSSYFFILVGMNLMGWFSRARRFAVSNGLDKKYGLLNYPMAITSFALLQVDESVDRIKRFLIYKDKYINDVTVLVLLDGHLYPIPSKAWGLFENKVNDLQVNGWTSYQIEKHLKDDHGIETVISNVKGTKESVGFLDVVRELDSFDTFWGKFWHLEGMKTNSKAQRFFKLYHLLWAAAHWVYKEQRNSDESQEDQIFRILKKEFDFIVKSLEGFLLASEAFLIVFPIYRLYSYSKVWLPDFSEVALFMKDKLLLMWDERDFGNIEFMMKAVVFDDPLFFSRKK